ncbi:ParB/RepB/Spo0J family partition protein [Lentzea albidocapillata]|uniref:ParB/RepB/Spo0J family partition protein n=1 Tax=Lentzea albidocapillata TaxID=40571 RepID=UPI0015A16493|nr:ParB/RepB/Spo0J family partition protein [Lentzea albidocapillata]
MNHNVEPSGLDRITVVTTASRIRLGLSELVNGASPRLGELRQAHVEVLAGLTGDALPPVLVCRHSLRVIDGHHRVAAALRRGDAEIDAEFFDGSPEEAFVHAVRANVRHGLPLSKEERELAVDRIIGSHPYFSDRAIAGIVGVSAKTVAAQRKRMSSGDAQPLVRVGRDGRSRPVGPAAGRLRAAEIIGGAPRTPLREVAVRAGISVATAHDVRKRLLEGADPVPDGTRLAGPRRGSRSFGRRGTGNAHKPEKVDRLAAMSALRNDPSLRLSEKGRGLLRWLEVQAMALDGREAVAAAVPAHCAEVVVDLVREQAHVLIRFADALQRKHAIGD